MSRAARGRRRGVGGPLLIASLAGAAFAPSAGCTVAGPAGGPIDDTVRGEGRAAEENVTGDDDMGAVRTKADGAATGATDASAGGTAAEAVRVPPDALGVTLRAVREDSAVGEPLELRVAATNAGERGAALLLWNTPFEPTLSADAFEVTRDGEPVAYLGRLVKRATPPPEDAIVRLPPGETLERTLDLARHYALDEPGTYAVALRERPVPFADPAGAPVPFARLVMADAAPLTVVRRAAGTD